MKNVFIKSTIILMLGTLVTRALGFIIRILFTRLIGSDGVNLFAIVMPTYSLLIAITQLGLPYAISTVMARGKHRGISLLTSIVPVSLLFDVVFIFIIYLNAPFIANNLLNCPDAYYPILATSVVIPFTTISGFIKGYFFGHQNMTPNAISNVFEQLTRLVCMMIILPILLKKSIVAAITGYIIISAISELVQIFVYMFFIPKNVSFKIEDLKFKKSAFKDVFSISIPLLSSRLIGNICYFLEPIILTNVLLFVGYSNSFIMSQYGIYNAYVIPILTMPSFFTLALNTTIIPEVSKHYNDKAYIKRRLIQSSVFSLVMGIIFCSFVYFKGSFLLKLIYDTESGLEYLKILAIIFPLFYLEGPSSSVLQALDKSSYSAITTTVASIVKLLTILILSLFSIGIYGLIIAEVVNILIVIIMNFKYLRKLKIL